MLELPAKPVIGLSPMDGVTDAAFRLMTNKHGKPDLTFTEFVHVVGLCRGGERLWHDLTFADLERPIIAQLFGSEPEYFYHSAKIVAELGFDGVDINMGCPARSVALHGAGAALIKSPSLAQEIVAATRQGVVDWVTNGELTGVSQSVAKRIPEWVSRRQAAARALGTPFQRYASGPRRSLISVSVKTRIGYDQVVVNDWIATLNQARPDWITVHGRTLKQMYTGIADWSAIAAAVQVSGVPILANGDVKTYADIAAVLEQTKAHGVLIGRASYGNPWLFRDLTAVKKSLVSGAPLPAAYAPSLSERHQVMLEHCRYHTLTKGEGAFPELRKHLAWYVSASPDAAKLRSALVRSESLTDVEQILKFC